MRIGLERRQDFVGGGLVIEGYGGCTVGSNDFAEGRELLNRGLPKRQKLVGKKCYTGAIPRRWSATVIGLRWCILD